MGKYENYKTTIETIEFFIAALDCKKIIVN